jgi:hypothetical protein
LKLIVTLTDWFGAKVVFAPPLATNPVPEADALEMVTFEFPVFVKTTDCDDEVPTVRLPKLRPEVFAESCSVAGTPMPVRLTAKVEGLALLAKEMRPETAPADAGWNETVKVVPCPAARVRGVGSPEIPKPVPEIATLLIVRPDVPTFDTLMV